ncbi:MAG: hypothetical protein IKH04_10975, partial [Kiritimatiellae bacterium]|nr:hypothetical protein [Kiritimatiellia bacterium]
VELPSRRRGAAREKFALRVKPPASETLDKQGSGRHCGKQPVLVEGQGCPLRCAWCHNPESQAFEPERRGHR